MIDQILKVLRFLRITDEQDRLSITNLLIFLCAFLLVTAPAITFKEVATLLLGILGYNFKKWIENKNDKKEE